MSRSQKAVVAGITAGLLSVAGVAGAAGLGAFSAHVSHRISAAGRAPAPRGDRAPAARNLAGRAARPLPPLRHLFAPDAVLTFDRPIGPRAVATLRRLDGLRAYTIADSGSVVIGRTRLRLLGVDAAKTRAFTPRFTATSTPLWTSVLRGELTVDYSLAGRLKHSLGVTLPLFGPSSRPVPVRVGAFATVGLGRSEGLIDRSLSPVLGLRPARVLVVSAPRRSDSGLRSDLATLFPHARLRMVRPQHVDQAVISAYARSVIPAGYLRLYRGAASTCRGLPWTVLAAIGTVETGNGANTSTSSKGAMGPMQFLPSTFAAYAVDADGDGVANIQDPADAIYSAARYLCAWGAGLGGQSLYAAIFAYNHADWYVREVIKLAIAYS